MAGFFVCLFVCFFVFKLTELTGPIAATFFFCQGLLSMECSRQEYWSGLPFPSPGDLPDPGIEPTSPVAPALQGHSLSAEPPGKPSFPLAARHAVTFPIVASPGMVTAWMLGTLGC